MTKRKVDMEDTNQHGPWYLAKMFENAWPTRKPMKAIDQRHGLSNVAWRW